MVVENLTAARYSRLDISNRSIATKTIATAAVIALANLIKFSLHNYVGEGTPFLIYFGFIMICGRFIGFWYAIACILVCGAIATKYFLLPYESFGVASVVKLLIFIVEGFFIALLTNSIRKSLNTLKSANQNFNTLISKSQDGLARLSKGGKILYISPSIENITGFNKDELQTGGFDIFPAEEDRNLVATQFLKVLKEPGLSTTIVHRYKNKDKEKKWMETIFTNHLSMKGINAVIANFRDVTERVEAENKKNDFLGIVAHEVKNPATVIKLNAELQQLALENNNYAQVKKFNSTIQQNVKKIFTLFNEFMDFSNFESALHNLILTDFNLRTAIDNALFSFRASYNNPVEITGESIMIIYADRSRIEQVLINLLSNAAKYSENNTAITINCNVTDNTISVAVADKGTGIPEDELELLFTKFHRVHTTKNKTKGYGLGLFICAEIIKAHKGKIGVESKEGEGSVFWFSLPLPGRN